MRISDWSSDVCSSDLPEFGVLVEVLVERVERRIVFVEQCGQPRLSGGKIGCRLRAGRGEGEGQRSRRPETVLRHHTLPLMFASDVNRLARGSQERGVGKECVSTCRSLWSTYL